MAIRGGRRDLPCSRKLEAVLTTLTGADSASQGLGFPAGPDGADRALANETCLLAVEGVSRTFGSTIALDAVNLSVRAGERVALLGENGAGKSTLSKIICGFLRPDSGRLAIEGATMVFGSPRDARAQGIVLIPQELAYVPDLSVAENIVLGAWPARHGTVSPRAIRRAAKHEAERFGITLPLDVRVRDLPLGEIQLIEILKALRADARILVLDEPTAALTAQERRRLMDVLRAQADRGAGIVLVSHRLDEVLAGTDTIHVVRDGRINWRGRPADTSRSDLVNHMTGAPAAVSTRRTPESPGAPVATISGWVQPPALPAPFDLTLFGFEVTVLFGLRGSGTDAVAESLGGVRRLAYGTLELNGRRASAPANPRAARRAGIAYVPADRGRQGLLMGQSVRANLTMMAAERIHALGWLRTARERIVAGQAVTTHRIRTRTTDQVVRELSGGNQQKVLVVSRLLARPRLLVLREPTRGVDVRSREEVHEQIRAAVRGGAAAIVATTDVEEAVHLSDRLVVMRAGRIVADLRGDHRVEDVALRYAEEVDLAAD